MRKLTLVAAVAVMAGSIAMAGTIVVPFFWDEDVLAEATGFPANNIATWVGIYNPNATGIQCTIQYYDADGTNRTPSANTFTLPGLSGWGFRPVADDPTEGAGQAVPNKDGGATAGACIITYTTPVGGLEISGRVISAQGINDSQSAYTIKGE